MNAINGGPRAKLAGEILPKDELLNGNRSYNNILYWSKPHKCGFEDNSAKKCS